MAKENKDKRKLNKMIDDMKDTNSSINTFIGGELDALIGGTDRANEIKATFDRYNELLKGATYSSKKPMNVSAKNAYDSLIGGLIGDRSNSNRINTGNAARDKFLNDRTSLERIFSGTDSQVASYFMSTNSNNVHICDEIESICTYMYQLEEAVEIIRDHVCTSEDINEDISVTITFPSSVDETSAAEYALIVKEAMNESTVHKKLRDHVITKAIKFGTSYLMIIPYSEIGVKMMTKDLTGRLVENTMYDDIMENVSKLYETDDDNKVEIPSCISENLKSIYICESESPPNIVGFGGQFDSMTSDLQDAVKKALKNVKISGIKNRSSDKNSFGFADGVTDPSKLDDIPGCFIKTVDPRQMIPIKVMDCIIGYYYFENYDYSRMGTTLSDVMSNNMNFNDRNIIIDNIVGTVLRRLKYGDLLEGDDNFKSMILNCILYAERRSNPLRIKFVPTEYVVPYNTNIDEEGNGRPILLKSLFFGRLYISLLLFLITTIVTKSTDTEFYYLKENALTTSQFINQVSDIIDQFKESNIDPMMIAQGNLLHGNRAVNKRYFLSTGTSDIKPFDVEVMSGQQVDTHTDFLNDLKKMAICSTGIPSVAVDMIDEPEFATMLTMSNTKVLKRCNNIKSDFDDPYTQTAKLIVKYTKPNAIPEDILNGMKCTLKKSKVMETNLTAEAFNNANQLAKGMAEVYFEVDGGEMSAQDTTLLSKIVKELTMQLTPTLPWGNIPQLMDKLEISAKQKSIKSKIDSDDNSMSDNPSDVFM